MIIRDNVVENESVIACPVCGFGCVHPVRVSVNRGGLVTTITKDAVKDGTEKPSGRGVAIDLSFVCEDGHAWTNTLQFHKGNTSVSTHSVVNLGPEISIPTIWRN